VFGDLAGKASVPCAKADNGTPLGDLPGRARVSCGDNGTPPLDREKKCHISAVERHTGTGKGSATSRQWSGTQARHQHHGNQRDGSSGRSTGWKRYVKDNWVNQEARTLDPEWRDPGAMRNKEITAPGGPI